MKTFKIRASSGGKLITQTTGKTNLEKYNEAVEKLGLLKIRLAEFKNPLCKSAIEIKEIKIPESLKLISELFLIKDIVELSETTKSYLQEWAKQQIYGIQKEIKSKYITKGLTQEDEGIDKAIEWLDLPFVLKNEQYFEDDFFCGTPDLILEDEVLDTKLSWSAFSFPLFEDKNPNKDYEIQLQIYMHLTGKKKARLVYLLLESPPELNYGEIQDFSNIPTKFRIKTFSFKYDEKIIKELQNKVIESRKYLDNLCIFTKEIRQD